MADFEFIMKHSSASSIHDEYYDLGDFERRISTSSKDAQVWFNRGLVWTYGFNHQAAAECFEQAIHQDGNCAMAYWGLAYALGPNYNKPWDVYDKEDLEATLRRTHAAAAKARTLATTATAVEKALASAIQNRYPESSAVEDPAKWNRMYSDAMHTVYEHFPDDLDVATLYADSLMNLTPWRLWDIHTGKPVPGAKTLEVKAVLDQALQRPGGLLHPGLLHLYIHLMEMSPTPEVALTLADRLRGLIPDAGHLQHMPSHLDVLCGDWRRAIASNSDGIRADEKYVAEVGAVNFYTLYRCHNYHFRIYAAMFAGQYGVASSTATALAATIPEALLRVESPPMADWLEGFLAMRVHVLIRFGRWKELIDLQLPDDKDLYCSTVATMQYAKGVALAATGQIREAEKTRELFKWAVDRVKPSRTVFNNSVLSVLKIASAMLDGELEYRKGNFDLAFRHLRKAIELDDRMPYDEPWGWMQPTRHAYGALLLEQGHVEEAAKVYAADLGLDNSLPRALQHPNNVWALHGYHECLQRLGRHAEANIIGNQLRMAMAVADVPIHSSCFCRQNDTVDGLAKTCCG